MNFTDDQLMVFAAVIHNLRNDIRQMGGQERNPDFSDLPGTDNEWMIQDTVNGLKAGLADPAWTPEKDHERWYDERYAAGWRWAEVRDNDKKLNPAMVHYSDLPFFEKMKDQVTLYVISIARAAATS